MADKPPAPPKSPARPKRPAKPKRPANLPWGRWLGDFEPLSKVEKQLVEHCARGAFLTLGNERPENALAGNKIRAGIIRFLLLGGDDQNPVHENGVMLGGAWIDDALDLRQACCRVRLVACACRFEEEVIAFETKIPALHLTGSSIPGLEADGMRVEGDLVLRDNFTATRQVRMLSAEIGGDLACVGGTFVSENGNALHADGIKVKGSVFLSDKFTATGQVRMVGAEIGAILSCISGNFSNENGNALHADRIKVRGNVFLSENFAATGQVRMLGAEIGGDLDCSGGIFSNEKGKALNLAGVSIRNHFFLRDGTFRGEVDLTTAFAGALIDDQACYQDAGLILDGFRYNRLIGPTGANARIGWLKRQRRAHLGVDFMPQPWEQLIRVLREMGHLAEAAEIAIEKQRMLRRARKIGRRQVNPRFSGSASWLNKTWVWFANATARGLHLLYGAIAGYGHRPSRIVIWMLGVCVLCSLAYYGGRYQGLIGPSTPVIQLHPRLAHCGTGGDPGTIPWTSPDCPVPPEYSTFQPFFYSLDVIIPFVDLHQEADWGPVVTNKRGETLFWGRILRGIMWFEIIFGWIASVMFVGIISRLVDKD